MNRNRKIALICFIIAFLAAAWLLKCSDNEQAPVKDPKEQRRRMNPGDMDKDTTFAREPVKKDGYEPTPYPMPPT